MKLSEVRQHYDVDAYRETLKIDQHRLDDMLMQQPIIQQTIAEMAAELASMRDSAKERLSRVDATVAKTLRNRITVEEGKASETRIDREIPMTQEHKDAFYIYNELSALAAQWDALKDTARNRAFVIRDLVSLYTANFFTDTSFRSQTNPQAVKELGYQEARAALAQGRRARRTLSGVHGEVDLLASIDDHDAPDAELSEPAEGATEVRTASRSTVRSARSKSTCTTTSKKSKSSAAQGVDNHEANEDTSHVSKTPDESSTNDVDASKNRRSRAAIKDRLRQRSNSRAIKAERGELDEDEVTDTQQSTEDTNESPRTTRRRRHSRVRPSSEDVA